MTSPSRLILLPVFRQRLAGTCFFAAAFVSFALLAADEREEFFENHVRPLLVDNCLSCHGASDQSGDLRLDSLEGLLKGGEHGQVIDADRPAQSRLLKAVLRQGDLKMPPDDPLSEQQIQILQHWVEQGAFWPDSIRHLQAPGAPDARDHWAFQNVVDPKVPEVSGDWSDSPLDAFILARLQSAGLKPSPEADRRTLIRRVYYTLTGLPPSPEDVEQFVQDPDPQAYENLVNRLLETPQYGEHWARHWLDVARYSDTKGYVYAREERFWIQAWAYRDWVVTAFNDDMPYNRFLKLQLAADQVEDRRQEDLAAMGYLTLGRRFLGVERDIIDDRIDVVTRGLMALTVGCARCHDHKHDPIPTADYYSLYGVFDSCREEAVRLDQPGSDEAFETELQKRQEALQDALVAARREWSDLVRSRVGDYLFAQTEPHKYPPKGFDQIFEKSDILPAFVHRWEDYLRDADVRHNPVFVPWQAYFAVRGDEFKTRAQQVTIELAHRAEEINPLVLDIFQSAPESISQVADRYAELFARVNAEWKKTLEAAEAEGKEPPRSLENPSAEQLRQVLYGPNAPCEVPHESIVHIESHVDSGTCNNLWKLQGEVDRWIIRANRDIPYAVTLVDRATPARPRVFRRGNPANKGQEVPRHFLSVLAGREPPPFPHGSGRLDLAEAIIDPQNPLTARVMVNRVWAHHFGAGLVTTTSDFGTRADPPSHPELLDWLATRFISEGWSLKELHRRILLSATFRQSSQPLASPEILAKAQRLDPDNRLLWRMNSKRLSFEELRDTLLAVSGKLDRSLGGRPVDLFSSPFPNRRTLYGLVDRQFFASTLRIFDFANPDLHIPQRPETTVPQQALFFLNDAFVLHAVRDLSASVSAESDIEQRINSLYRNAYQRDPTPAQLQLATGFLKSAESPEAPRERPTSKAWSYGYGTFNEASGQVDGWTELPQFTGDAWQGGEKWPDSNLGWVQLTARGGHPGNDRAHASVRRWTSPRAMTVRIQSNLVHEPEPGDGIRAFVISSRSGLLDSIAIHKNTHQFDSSEITVEPGGTLDFVVDINQVLNSDQYLWHVVITEETETGIPTTWDSKLDFTVSTVSQLSPLEQLAHVLLSSNEFLFID